jgi:hypothetical protein
MDAAIRTAGLEAKSAQNGLVLTEAPLVALEPRPRLRLMASLKASI